MDVTPPEPRVTRRRGGDLPAPAAPSSSRMPPPAPGPMEDVRREDLLRGRKQRASPQEKAKAPAYRLASDIETSTDLKSIFETRFLDARVEFTMRDLLGLAKKEFHDFIIDIIKRKRQTISDPVVSQLIQVIDDAAAAAVYDADVCADEIDDEVQEYVALVARSAAEDDEGEEVVHVTSGDDFRTEHWARATDEVKVYLGGLTEPLTALVDTGSEINIISKEVFDKGKWPINLALRSANGVKSPMYGACPCIPVRIGNVEIMQHFFVQENAPSRVILGQPYITAARMQTIVMKDGSHFARIRSLDDRNSVRNQL